MGLGYARKHAAWYLESFPGAREFRAEFNRVGSAATQLELLDRFFATLKLTASAREAAA